jgi:hypothetical protein
MIARDWKEAWVDHMGLIVALSGNARFAMLDAFKLKMFVDLTPDEQAELRDCLRRRFTPSSCSNKLPKEP